MIPTVTELWYCYKTGRITPDETELLRDKLREIHSFLTTTKPTISDITRVISDVETQRWKDNNPF